ncbi:MAG: aminoglycoside phosphotransferase family protein [Ardenticatenales bacterium]|nr:aminoglycoside phosphotransferase family protein [Ardenticatenales bacterium]
MSKYDAELIGKGRTAELFRVDAKTVLKLFFEPTDEAKARHEVARMEIVNRLGLNVPRCHGLETQAGRPGIRYEYIAGRSMVERLQRNPLSARSCARILAREHLAIHAHGVSELPDETERFAATLARVKSQLGDRYEPVRAALSRSVSGTQLCHGDFHPDNILLSKNGPIVIDWNDCYAGTPAGDVARTYLILSAPTLPDDLAPILRSFVRRLKRFLAKSYLTEYLRYSEIAAQAVDGWMGLVAAVRLAENVPGEAEWLQGIVDMHYAPKRA